MAIFRCKYCAENMEADEGKTICECPKCSKVQTISGTGNKQLAALFSRADRLRAGMDFDKAFSVYNSIISDYPEEAEAYWGLVLCRLGVVYSRSSDGTYIPLCCRASETGVREDRNYELVNENADSSSRRLYRSQAKAIDTSRTEMLELIARQKACQVFISCCNTDEQGHPTPESQYSDILRQALEECEITVFRSADLSDDMTQKEKLAAVQAGVISAGVMIVIGSDIDFLNSPDVKNEWGYYLSALSCGKKGTLILCTSGMDSYDIPVELGNIKTIELQDEDSVTKLADEISGIVSGMEVLTKTVGNAPDDIPPGNTGSGDYSPQLRRIELFLSDREFGKASDYCDKLLDEHPEDPELYLLSLLAGLKLRSVDELSKASSPFDEHPAFQKLVRFGDPELTEKLYRINDEIRSRNKTEYLQKQYDVGCHVLDDGVAGEESVLRTLELFESLGDYKDSRSKAEECRKRVKELMAERARLEKYNEARQLMKSGVDDCTAGIQYFDPESVRAAIVKYEKAIRIFLQLENYLDSADRIGMLKDDLKIAEDKLKTIEEESGRRQEENMKRERLTYIVIIGITAAIVVIGIIGMIVSNVIIPEIKYNNASSLLQNGDYDLAADAFKELGSYKDSDDKYIEAGKAKKYHEAQKAMAAEEYKEAIEGFESTKGYLDSEQLITECKYQTALKLFDGGNLYGAREGFEDIPGYKDSDERAQKLAEQLDTAFRTAFEKRNNDFGYDGRISAGLTHSVGLKADGRVVATGENGNLQCSTGSWRGVIAVTAGGDHTLGITQDGTVIASGKNMSGQCEVSSWKDIVQTAAGDGHSVGLKKDGSVVAVGKNKEGQCKTDDWAGIRAVAAGSDHTVGLKWDGTVVAVGNSDSGQCSVSGWKDITAVTAGRSHTVGLKKDGKVIAAGNNDNGQCDVGKWTDITAVAAGADFTLGLKKDGTVVVAGQSDTLYWNLSDWTDIVAITAGKAHALGLKKDGSVVSAGKNFLHECDVSGWTLCAD